MNTRLSGKRAIAVGCAQGFGAASAHRLAEAGAAAGDKNAPPRKKLFVEHLLFPPRGNVC